MALQPCPISWLVFRIWSPENKLNRAGLSTLLSAFTSCSFARLLSYSDRFLQKSTFFFLDHLVRKLFPAAETGSAELVTSDGACALVTSVDGACALVTSVDGACALVTSASLLAEGVKMQCYLSSMNLARLNAAVSQGLCCW